MEYRTRGYKFVAICRKTGLYLRFDCKGFTKDRTWAWSGNYTQSQNMVRQFGLRERVSIIQE